MYYVVVDAYLTTLTVWFTNCPLYLIHSAMKIPLWQYSTHNLSKWILLCPSPTYDRGPSDHTWDSDNNNSFQHHSDITNGRNIELLVGDSDWKLMARWGFLQTFCQNPLGFAWDREEHRIHVGTCISYCNKVIQLGFKSFIFLSWKMSRGTYIFVQS